GGQKSRGCQVRAGSKRNRIARPKWSEERLRMIFRFIKKAALMSAVCGLVSLPAFAQAGWGNVEAPKAAPPAAKKEKVADAKATPRTADGHPDFNGVWGTLYGENYPVDKIGKTTYIGFGKRPDETQGNPFDVNDQDAVDLLLSRKDGLDGGSVHDNRIA